MPASPHHPVARRALAALCGVTVAVGLCACTPEDTAGRPVDHVLLSPTADPSTSQTVTWRAAGAQESFLEIGPEDGSGQTTRVRGRATGGEEPEHSFAATATGLEPDTAYRYRIGQSGGGGDGGGENAVSDWRTFTTAAEGAEPFTFLYFGDIQNDIAEEAAPVIQAGLEAAPDAELAVHSGDLVDSADSDDQWDAWFEAFGPATGSMNHVAAPGNHEYDGEELSDHWVPQFPGAGNGPDRGQDLPETVYHTDYQGVRFVVLNSNHSEVDPEDPERWLRTQQRWLERTLADNPNPWTVVTFHHPLFSSDPDRDNTLLREAWLPVLEEYDVDLVLQGHDHSYSRGTLAEDQETDTNTAPVYVTAVTGPKMYDASDDNWTGHGAEVRVQLTDTQTFQTVSVDGDTLEYRARTADGRTVDSFTIVAEDGDKRVTDGP